MFSTKIFFTGVTGFVGVELIKKLLLLNPHSEFWLLIRDSRHLKAEDRFEQLILKIAKENAMTVSSLRPRLNLIKGDLVSIRFGLSINEFQNLAIPINKVYHCAASINLIGDLESIRKINYFGTEQVLNLAKISFQKGRFQRLNYLSTAYIAGKRFGIIYENELAHNKGFCNSYERTKYETELMVEKAKAELPITIYRPSIIMGDSETGKTSAFNVIYEPMRLAYLGKLTVLPISRSSIFDVVPVDYVCDAIIALSSLEKETIGRTFHLTAGENQGILSGEMASYCYNYVKDFHSGKETEWNLAMPKFIHPLVLKCMSKALIPLTKNKRRRFYEKVNTYSNYGYYYKKFNTSDTAQLLSPLEIKPPSITDYLDQLINLSLIHI